MIAVVASLLALLPSWLDPQTIIDKGGLWLVAAIVFAESGLLFGFFLPGDSLLFITGFLASKPEGLPHIGQPLPIVVLVCAIAFSKRKAEAMDADVPPSAAAPATAGAKA